MKCKLRFPYRTVALCLCLVMLLAVMPVSVYAAETEDSGFAVSPVHFNPYYTAEQTSETYGYLTYAATRNAAPDYVYSVQDAAALLREGMKNRREEIDINLCYEGRYNVDIFETIFDAAVAHTGVPTEGDYLAFQYKEWIARSGWYHKNGMCYITIKYCVAYYSTAEQEAEVDRAVAELLEALQLDAMSNVDKVRTVYQWMAENIVYDNQNVNDYKHTMKYTAYAALMDQTAVCQGYANLLYRLLLELGIDCRIVAGIGSGVPHAWNIIGLDGLYYNADVTWDAENVQAERDYACFLRNDANLTGHIREERFLTEGFMAMYPMSEQDYVITVPSVDRPFVDVTAEDYFYEPVLWAVERGVTGGINAMQFAPGNPCTRGQVVTFLWRAKGSPEPESTNHPFTDISADKYYYKAVLWAVENGITAGLTATTFAPNNACTRGQIATFLWRANGSPEPQSSENPFSDVTEGPFYKAILWAVEEGITTGYTDGTFRPNASCTRGHIVTFLYRAEN